jgi:hypothetical protein
MHMTAVAHRDLPETIAAVVASVPGTGLERWHTVLQFEPDRGPTLHLVVAAGQISLRRGGHPSPTTAVRTTREALAEVFLTGRDITHHFANGDMRLRCGDYYDVIFLSRALGRLRRDRAREVTG